jgi:hypothetical protein
MDGCELERYIRTLRPPQLHPFRDYPPPHIEVIEKLVERVKNIEE